jgi:hypothetical protein
VTTLFAVVNDLDGVQETLEPR